MSSPEEGNRFFDERWPEARAVSDESKRLYSSFGLARGSVDQVAGLRVWLPGLKAVLKHGVGKPTGDPLMMSGWFLLAGGEIVWEQKHQSSGEERRYAELERAYLALLEERDEPAP